MTISSVNTVQHTYNVMKTHVPVPQSGLGGLVAGILSVVVVVVVVVVGSCLHATVHLNPCPVLPSLLALNWIFRTSLEVVSMGEGGVLPQRLRNNVF